MARAGWGAVYLAERADGAFDQRVAIKVVRGLLDQDRVRRFSAERQILASLQHPNIARLVDGGTTEDGWPYLVMEYVEGQAIDLYAEQRGLGLRDRLALFITVCEAVGHAHRHLIVHRDIKPSNIIVTAEGTPKLLDFGIAKLLDTDDPELSARTMTGMHLLTPDYAAPEQVRGEPVTTATDVYALGVLLFELVTNQRPHTFKTLTAQEIERVVCDTEAPRPSTVRGGLPDDLDIIIGTALSKDIRRRYASVEALVADLMRFLDGLPIHARPATWRYRAARFVSRHRWEVGVATLFVAMLVAFSVLVSLQAARLARERDVAQQERDAAEDVSSFLVSLFEVNESEPIARRNGDRAGAARSGRHAGRERLVVATPRAGPADGHDGPGLPAARAAGAGGGAARAGALAAGGGQPGRVRRRGRHPGGDGRGGAREGRVPGGRAPASPRPGDTAAAPWRDPRQDRVLDEQPRPDARRAGPLSRSRGTAARRDRDVAPVRAPGHPQVAMGLNNLGQLLRRTARTDEAEPVLREALEIRRAAFKTNHPLLANSLMQYGQLQNQLGHYDVAERYMREALEMRLTVLGPDHPLVGTAYNNLASLFHDIGAYDKAEPMYRAALEISLKTHGPDHPETAVTINNLASLLEDQGEAAAAEPMFRRALEIRRAAFGEQHPAVARGMHNLARTLIALSRFAEAEALLTRALEIRRKVLGASHVEVAGSLGLLAQVRAHTGRLTEAVSLSDESLRMLRGLLAADHPTLATALIAHSQLLIDAGREREAVATASEAVAIRRARLSDGHPQVEQAEAVLAQARGSAQR